MEGWTPGEKEREKHTPIWWGKPSPFHTLKLQQYPQVEGRNMGEDKNTRVWELFS